MVRCRSSMQVPWSISNIWSTAVESALAAFSRSGPSANDALLKKDVLDHGGSLACLLLCFHGIKLVCSGSIAYSHKVLRNGLPATTANTPPHGQLSLWQVDAFTSVPLEGNPCAVVLDADDLSTETMQAVAREMNLSETAFVLRSQAGDVRARFFPPAKEIPLAGHPALSTIFTLVTTGRLPEPEGWSTVRLELNVGVIPVEVLVRDGAVMQVVMSQKKPQFLSSYHPSQVMPLFGLTAADALSDFPLQTVSTGTPQLMVPVQNLEVLRRIQVQTTDFIRFRKAADFFSPHLFCVQGATPAGHTFARHFGTPPDLFENPFTGPQPVAWRPISGTMA